MKKYFETLTRDTNIIIMAVGVVILLAVAIGIWVVCQVNRLGRTDREKLKAHQ